MNYRTEHAEWIAAHPDRPFSIATLATTYASDIGQTEKLRLEYLRGEIEAERISWSELNELQNLAEYIEPGDVVLLEWAGVPEFPDDEEEV